MVLSSSPHVVVHLAARVHQVQAEGRETAALYWQVNTQGATCFTHPVVIRKTYLVSDGEDGSVPEPTRRIVIPLERPARLLSLPPA
jgi:hypothetical protein